jgi:FtsH-binding integral membrane protein
MAQPLAQQPTQITAYPGLSPAESYLSSWYRVLFCALLAFLVLGIVAIFVSIPNANVIWSVAGLVIFGGYTILDFNRLRRAGAESAVPIAAGILLDITNVFSFLLELFGGERD